MEYGSRLGFPVCAVAGAAAGALRCPCAFVHDRAPITPARRSGLAPAHRLGAPRVARAVHHDRRDDDASEPARHEDHGPYRHRARPHRRSHGGRRLGTSRGRRPGPLPHGEAGLGHHRLGRVRDPSRRRGLADGLAGGPARPRAPPPVRRGDGLVRPPGLRPGASRLVALRARRPPERGTAGHPPDGGTDSPARVATPARRLRGKGGQARDRQARPEARGAGARGIPPRRPDSAPALDSAASPCPERGRGGREWGWCVRSTGFPCPRSTCAPFPTSRHALVRGGCRRSSVRRAAVGGPGQNRGKDVTSRREFR